MEYRTISLKYAQKVLEQYPNQYKLTKVSGGYWLWKIKEMGDKMLEMTRIANVLPVHEEKDQPTPTPANVQPALF